MESYECGKPVSLWFDWVGNKSYYKSVIPIMVITTPRGKLVLFEGRWSKPKGGLVPENTSLDRQCQAIRDFMEQHRG